jgi:hypothetical protein
MRLHAELPLIALLGLVHLGVAFTAAALGRTRSSDQRGIDRRPSLQEQALGAHCWCVRRCQRHQFGTVHHQTLLAEELALARPQGQALKSALAPRLICFMPSLSHIGSARLRLRRPSKAYGKTTPNAVPAGRRHLDRPTHRGQLDPAWFICPAKTKILYLSPQDSISD